MPKTRRPKTKRRHANTGNPRRDPSRNAKKARTGRFPQQREARQRDRPKSRCWGCSSDTHSLRDCDIVTNEVERTRIVDEKRAELRRRRANKPASEYVDSYFCRQMGANPGSYRLKLNGVKVLVLLDDGSDRSILSRSWLATFQANHHQGTEIPEQQLQTQKTIALADPKHRLTTSSYVELDITFPVYDNLFLRRRKFFVVDQAIGAPIIGHSELSEIGVDAKSTLSRLSYSHIDEDDEMEDPTAERESQVSLKTAIEQMLKRAKENGMHRRWWKKLCDLVWDYEDIFRVDLTTEPPADVTPMDVSIKPGKESESWTTYNRKYTRDELKWLKTHIDSLVKGGFLKRNPHARFASPALVIPKPGRPGEYRLCVDVKRANSIVMSTHWPMPHIDTVLRQIGHSKYFASLDAFKGYWLFPCTDLCAELYSIKTPFGVYTPTRIIQGAQEAVRYFQAGMEEALDIGSREDILLWVDDILSHAKSLPELLASLEYIFKCCRERKIRLSAKKCNLYMTEVTWCGRTISERGVGFDPEYIQGIKDLELPKSVGDLQQFICSMNWVRSSIPNYASEMAKLTECLQQITSKIGTTKKRVLERRQLNQYSEWSDALVEEFDRAKKLLESCICATYYDPSKRLCIFPDASDHHWGLVITQVPTEDLDKPHKEQSHSPLLMMSGSFKGSSRKWHIKAKEAYPIIVALDKARDILKNPDGFSLFSDHKNLVYVFDPERRQVVKHADDRLSRWALTLMSYRFTVEHIPGEDNVVADMLSRWRVLYPQTVCGASFKPGICSALHKADFKWPSVAEIERLQEALTQSEITKLKLVSKNIKDHQILVRSTGDRIYVPDCDLRVRLCVIAHAGSSGHRGIAQTVRALRKYYWPTMRPDVNKFCKQCLHCAVADPRKVIPRPLGTQTHAKQPNELLHYDFIHIGPSTKGHVYLLVIKDDFTGFVNFYPCASPTSDVVVESLLSWYSLFGVATCHVSDQGSHFKNAVVKELNRKLTTKHHFTLPYAPWSNGTVERVNREIRRLIRSWISEFRIELTAWPDLIPLMVHVLNFSNSTRSGYAPAELFGGFRPRYPLETILTSSGLCQISVGFTALEEHMKQLRRTLDTLHKEVREKERTRGTYSLLRNRPNFDKGDYVMFATRRNDTGPSRLSQPCWTGPYQVLECQSDWDFVIKHLITGKKFHAHSARLKYYCDKELKVTADLKHQIAHDEMRYKVTQFLGHQLEDGNYKLHTQWQGFDAEEATWEPIEIMIADVPKLAAQYVRSLHDHDPHKLHLQRHLDS